MDAVPVDLLQISHQGALRYTGHVADAGGVAGEVEPPEPLQGHVDHASGVGIDGDVGLHELRRVPHGLKGRDGLRSVSGIVAHDDDVGTGLREGLGGGQPDSR